MYNNTKNVKKGYAFCFCCILDKETVLSTVNNKLVDRVVKKKRNRSSDASSRKCSVVKIFDKLPTADGQTYISRVGYGWGRERPAFIVEITVNVIPTNE